MSERFPAFRVFEENGKIQGRVVDQTLDDLSAGNVVIDATHSSVNYKDALAATGAGKIIRRFPLIAGIDVAAPWRRHRRRLRAGGVCGGRGRVRRGARWRVRPPRARAGGVGRPDS
jgi:hypothetical protein